MDGQVEFGEIFESGVVGRLNEDEYESGTASGFMVGDDPSGDDQDIDRPPRKKRNYRHTRRQIQELEAFFKECPHPDEKQRRQLSRRLCLENKQIKFWFQNKRTQMKTQMGRQEISILKHENDKLRVENMSMREAMRRPICFNCGGPVEERNLWIENARLKDEFDRVCALAEKFSGMPVSSLTNTIPSLMPMEPAVRSNGFCNLSNVTATPPLGNGFICGVSSALPMVPPSQFSTSALPMVPPSQFSTGVEGLERSMYWELALAAMDELVKMAQTDEPLWLPNLEGGRETLNHEEYKQVFPSCIGRKQNGFVTEATRESGMLIINSLALVEILMDANQWVEMFPCMISRSSTTEVISSGVDGTRNGALQLMHAELQVLSPLVPIRDVDFIRFCKQHAEGVWAVVDVSIDINRDTLNTAPFASYRRLPSGCLVQDMPNGYSKVTWVEHAEYDENSIHQIYRPLISAGMGFGAQRWVATLQRQCECLATLISTAPNPTDDQTAAMGPSGGWRSILKLAQRMTAKFCAGVCASKEHKWNKICAGNVDQDVRMMSRKSVDDPGEPLGVVLSAATSVWLPVSPQKLFDFLRDEQLRTEWDVLSNGGPMQKMANFDKGQDQGNYVCLLRSTSMNANQSGILILQETFNDESGSLVVYAPVDMPALDTVMSGGDSACVALLPSGFAILPDGPQSGGPNNNCNGMVFGGGSLLTVGFQILMNSTPTAKLTAESVETVNNLISCTIQKIKAALQHEN